jgi:hypothetical protein
VDTIPSENGLQTLLHGQDLPGFQPSHRGLFSRRKAISSVKEEPCKGGILVEEGILRRAESPGGATFSYHPPMAKDVAPIAVIIPER